MTRVILIERDLKGHYERFALTPEEFQQQFVSRYKDMSEPDETGTLRKISMTAYIWYRISVVGYPEWNRFFTDMSYGLALNDISSGNLASIREELFQSLREHLPVITSAKKAF